MQRHLTGALAGPHRWLRTHPDAADAALVAGVLAVNLGTTFLGPHTHPYGGFRVLVRLPLGGRTHPADEAGSGRTA